jgi:hypothetical protein
VPTEGPSDDWHRYSSRQAGFSAEYPVEPSENNQTMDNPELGTVEVREVAAKEGNTQYTVVYLDYPDRVVESGNPDVLLDNVFKEVVKENTVEMQASTTLGGFPALTGEFQMGTQGYARYKSVLVGNRIFQVLALTPDETRDRAEATRFLNSFRILSPAGRVTPTRPGRATPTPGSVDPGNWTSFTSDEGQFSVLMPTTPRENTQNTTAANVELTLYTFVSTEGDAEYTLVYVDYPPEVMASGEPRTMLANAFAGVHGTNAVEVQEEITVQGNPGLYGEFNSSSGYAWYKAVLRDNRLYQLIAIALDKATNEEDAKRFLDSFQITGGTTEEPTPGAVEPTPDGSQGNMSGMTGLNNTVRFTINEIKYDSGQSEILKPETGNEYLFLTMTLENTGTEDESISTAFASIEDSAGNAHGPTYNVVFEDMLNLTVPAGETVRGTMAFEIPTDATGLVYSYDPPLEDNTLRLKLDR